MEVFQQKPRLIFEVSPYPQVQRWELRGCTGTLDPPKRPTLQGTITYPPKAWHFESMIFRTSRLVGYVNYLEGNSLHLKMDGWKMYVLFEIVPF